MNMANMKKAERLNPRLVIYGQFNKTIDLRFDSKYQQAHRAETTRRVQGPQVRG